MIAAITLGSDNKAQADRSVRVEQTAVCIPLLSMPQHLRGYRAAYLCYIFCERLLLLFLAFPTFISSLRLCRWTKARSWTLTLMHMWTLGELIIPLVTLLPHHLCPQWPWRQAEPAKGPRLQITACCCCTSRWSYQKYGHYFPLIIYFLSTISGKLWKFDTEAPQSMINRS